MTASHALLSTSASGHAALTVELVDGLSAATEISATSPLKLLVPRSRAQSVWAYTSSFGGGMVAGDETHLDLHVAPGARCFVGTQASTKVYRNPELRPCGHKTSAKVAAGALLVFAPDPVQPFAESSYTQRQDFHLAENASLALVDWFSSGRSACGERWRFHCFQSRNAVYRSPQQSGSNLSSDSSAGEMVFLDSLRLDSEDASLTSQHRTGRFNCFASLLFLGPALSTFAMKLLATISQEPVRREGSLLFSASPVDDGVVLRVAGVEVEAVGRELHRHLAPLSSLLGDDPWARKG